jgi:hypothetical protein
MAEASGDVVKVPTPVGEVEALRMGRSEAGSSRWQVKYPWGAETFFGTSAELAEHARRRIAKDARQSHWYSEPRRH